MVVGCCATALSFLSLSPSLRSSAELRAGALRSGALASRPAVSPCMIIRCCLAFPTQKYGDVYRGLLSLSAPLVFPQKHGRERQSTCVFCLALSLHSGLRSALLSEQRKLQSRAAHCNHTEYFFTGISKAIPEIDSLGGSLSISLSLLLSLSLSLFSLLLACLFFVLPFCRARAPPPVRIQRFLEPRI